MRLLSSLGMGVAAVLGRGMGIISYLRGKVFVIDQPAYYAGINLAYAGKRAREGNKMKQIMDHPRIRGEKIIAK